MFNRRLISMHVSKIFSPFNFGVGIELSNRVLPIVNIRVSGVTVTLLNWRFILSLAFADPSKPLKDLVEDMEKVLKDGL